MERNKNAIMSNQSTEKALRIMEYLASCGRPMRLLDISEALEINPSTAGRFLNALINCGYVMQDPETLRYSMTYKICRIANMINVENDVKIQQITHPYLEQISEIFDESSCVSIERDMEMVYIDVYTGRGRALMSRQRIGNTAPMHCTGNGKLCLLNYSGRAAGPADLPAGTAAVHGVYADHKGGADGASGGDPARSATPATKECEIGMRCLAYPIRDYTRRIIGGISITGPSSRLNSEVLMNKAHYLQNRGGGDFLQAWVLERLNASPRIKSAAADCGGAFCPLIALIVAHFEEDVNNQN